MYIRVSKKKQFFFKFFRFKCREISAEMLKTIIYIYILGWGKKSLFKKIFFKTFSLQFFSISHENISGNDKYQFDKVCSQCSMHIHTLGWDKKKYFFIFFLFQYFYFKFYLSKFFF